MRELTARDLRPGKVHAAQIRIREVGAGHASVAERSSSEIRAGKISATERTTGEIHSGKVCIREIHAVIVASVQVPPGPVDAGVIATYARVALCDRCAVEPLHHSCGNLVRDTVGQSLSVQARLLCVNS